MKKIKRENAFLIIWVICVLLLVGVCNLGFIRGTMAGFGNLSGQLTAAYVIEYSSNYPSELGISNEFKREAIVSQNYIIKDNQFELDGYEFIGWNSSVDGLGDIYLVNDIILLEKNITLYAQWKKIEVIIISYGDVNLNGVIDEEDYSLIEKSINKGLLLEGQALLNADCNVDGKVDLVDADIIKQAILGTDGYSNSLPNKPILKYEIYVSDEIIDGDNNEGDDVDKPTDGDNDESTDDNENETANDNNSSGNNSGGSSGTGSGNGNGSGGSGSSSSGSGGTNSKPSSGGSTSNNKKPNSSNGSSSGESQGDSSLKEEDKNNDNVTDKEEDNSVGTNDNSDIDSNKNSVIVNKNNNNKSYVWIIIVLMCFISLRLILYVINRFRSNNKDE